MNRRDLLKITTCLGVGLAGCSSRNVESEANTTPSQSTTRTTPISPTRTHEPVMSPETVTAQSTRTPSELASNPEFTFSGTSPSIREFDLSADQQFVIFTFEADSDAHLQALIESDEASQPVGVSLNGEQYTQTGAYLDGGHYTVDIGGYTADWQMSISIALKTPTYALPATIRGVGPTVIGEYQFNGYTRFTNTGSEDESISIEMLAPESRSFVSFRNVTVEEISGRYFLCVDTDGPWEIRMEAEDTTK